jgi:hypothetical protein
MNSNLVRSNSRSQNLIRITIRDFNIEFLFNGNCDLHLVQRVQAKIINEMGVKRQLVMLYNISFNSIYIYENM